ncbi:MAG: SRPBCC family protein [Candidatus Bathyarchaeia archaeon]
MARIEKSIVINAPPEKVFALSADVERMPEWMDTVKEVKVTSKERTGVGATSHWVVEAGGTRAEFDSETTEWVENEKIAWRTTSGNITMFGSGTLKPVERGTEYTWVMDYELPYSILGKIIDKLKVSKDFEKDMARALQNLKNLLEKK